MLRQWFSVIALTFVRVKSMVVIAVFLTPFALGEQNGTSVIRNILNYQPGAIGHNSCTARISVRISQQFPEH
ncbi:hypothetical protein BDP27DRAFT_1341572 [Rhodocollybia butyracea]|uniref:Uncharacterized protein n=1 Tax=Rhodocollybia butyracea TaxID=206335 RepID=A0A9P5PBV6_9AGAR|nr:hypothetical protein BDP27DRAFT_1341572 [Rhodocollybia butyracea]